MYPLVFKGKNSLTNSNSLEVFLSFEEKTTDPKTTNDKLDFTADLYRKCFVDNNSD